MGNVVSIVYRSQEATNERETYVRTPLSEANLIAGYGIKGDAKGGKGTRHLNVMATETLKNLASEGFLTAPGQMGEQIILDGVDIDSLSHGTRLQIGESARIEITEPRTGCGKFERVQSKLKESAEGRLGVMARVVADGVIRVGDAVEVL